MKFAFSTVSCPKWDFETIVSRAREYGYDGVEIRGFLNESLLTSANVFLTDPDKVSRAFSLGGVKIACLASSIAMEQAGGSWRFWKPSPNDQHAQELRTFIDTAHRLA